MVALNYLIHLVFFSSVYSLDFIDYLRSCFSFQSPSTSVCGHYCIVYIFLRSPNYSLSDIVYFHTNISSRDLWIEQYIYNLQIRLRILNSCFRTNQSCKLQCQFC